MCGTRGLNAQREHLQRFQGRLPESHGRNLAVTVLYMPYSLDSGRVRIVHFGTDPDSRTTFSQKCEAVPRRARIQSLKTFVSLNSRLESNKEEE